jgi:hypothetical protein
MDWGRPDLAEVRPSAVTGGPVVKGSGTGSDKPHILTLC